MIEAMVADTSLLINFFNGHLAARSILENKIIWISGITEIELLASSNLSQKQRSLIKEFIEQLHVVDLNKSVKDFAIRNRIFHKLKITDSIIAATAMFLNLPVYTFDKDFSKIKDSANIVLVDF